MGATELETVRRHDGVLLLVYLAAVARCIEHRTTTATRGRTCRGPPNTKPDPPMLDATPPNPPGRLKRLENLLRELWDASQLRRVNACGTRVTSQLPEAISHWLLAHGVFGQRAPPTTSRRRHLQEPPPTATAAPQAHARRAARGSTIRRSDPPSFAESSEQDLYLLALRAVEPPEG